MNRAIDSEQNCSKTPKKFAMRGVFAFIHGDCISCGKGGGRCFKSLSRNHAVQTREPHAKGAKELGSCVQENKSPDGERNFGGCSRLSRIPPLRPLRPLREVSSA